MRIASLAGFVLIFWLALSGHYTLWLIAMGVVSTAVVVWVADRMGVADEEGHPVQMLPRAPLYFPWLGKEIAKSAWGVTKIILSPRLPISPTMTIVTSSQRTAAGMATYANSITLTPGTITVGVDGDRFTVHALSADGARELEQGEMDKRVSRYEGSA